jgi:two-component system, NarL family, nitrate/nitrite response regulator NarL
MSAGRTSISLVIADDHPVVLEGIVGVLAAESDFELLATCRTGTDALRAISELRPDVAVLDISMAEMSGLDVLLRMRSGGVETKAILLTANVSDSQLLSAIERGARALLIKDMSIGELAPVIRRVAAGERSFPSDQVDAALERELSRDSVEQRFNVLSAREREVVLLVAEGLSNKEVGNKLNLAEGTVKIHLHRIFQKLGVSNRTSLAGLALALRDRQMI